MKKILLTIFLGIFLVSLISAIPICVDKDDPSAPSNLAVSGEVGNIVLTWGASTDVPECSGIESYTIKRNNPDNSITPLNVVNSNTLSFIDTNNLAEGTYSYTVYAVDKVGHNTGKSIKNDVVIEEETGGERRVRGGGGGGSYVCYENWQCNPWSECIDGVMVRTCTDFNKCGTTKEKPQISSTCSLDEEAEGVTLTEEPSEEGFFSRITGAAIGGITDFAKSGTGAFVFVILIVGATGLVILRLYKLRRR